MLRTLLLVVLSASYSAAVKVSICRDATYDIPIDAALLCAGSGPSPAGSRCPKAGDMAVADCRSYLPSYTGNKCVAPEDAVCQIVNDHTWGCVLPSVGCDNVVKPKCPTWTYDGKDTIDLNGPGFFDGSHNYDESWFVQTTALRDLYNCGENPTPAPSTPSPTPEGTFPAPEATPAPSKPTPDDMSTYDDVSNSTSPGEESYGEREAGGKKDAPADASTVSLSSVEKNTQGGLGAGTIVGVAAAALAVAVAAVVAAFVRERQNAEVPTSTRERRESIDYEMALTPVNEITSPRVMTSPRM